MNRIYSFQFLLTVSFIIMHKKSTYNIRVPFRNLVIYYNSFTDQYIALSCKADTFFNNSDWETKFADVYPTQFAKLIELGFIIDANRDELSEIRFQNKQEAFSSREHFLMIYPTQDCNLKCWYCYESHVPNSFMSKEVQDRIVRNIKKRIEDNSFDSLKIAFFGGEPMLGFEDIAYPLAKRIKKVVTEAGKSFHTFFVTNATLIGKKEVDMLRELNPYFQITLDGNKAKHNAVRKRKDGIQPTYSDIIQAIKCIVDNIYNINDYKQPLITVRINYDNNTLVHLPELFADLDSIDRSAVMIHLERVWQTKDSVTDEQRRILRNTIHKLISDGFYVSHGCFGEKRVSCPAESANYFIVNYDGNLYRCNGRTLTPEQREGEMTENGDIVWDKTKQSLRLGLATFENPQCIKCNMLPRCMGPCSQKIAEHKGFCKEICTLETMDIPLNEYLIMEFENRIKSCNYERIK